MPNPNLDRDQRRASRGAERNRDPGADPEREGLPGVADDATPGAGTVPEPQQVTVPTEEPVAATSYGTTTREQVEGEPLELRLAHEEPEREGLPGVADDETPGAGTVPEPQQVTVPTEEPVAATSYGTTTREQVEGEPLDLRLAHEEPERPETEDPDDRLAAEEAAMRVEEEPPS